MATNNVMTETKTNCALEDGVVSESWRRSGGELQMEILMLTCGGCLLLLINGRWRMWWPVWCC